MDEDWWNTFGILMLPLGAGPEGMALRGPKSILYIVMLHIKSKVIKSTIQWCKNYALGACLGH